MRHFFFTVFFFSVLLSGGLHGAKSLSLLDNINATAAGDFVVVAQGKTRLVLHINAHDSRHIYLEEITVSASDAPEGSWKEWMNDGAPRALSWVTYEIERKTGRILRCYSFSRQGWLDVSNADAFITTLMTLKYGLVPEKNRRRAGPPPTDGAHDNRPLWKPRMVVDGVVMNDVAFDVWKTRWPHDGSELSNKEIELYLHRDKKQFAAYFPTYITIRDGMGKATARIVDSGKGMVSPHAGLSAVR